MTVLDRPRKSSLRLVASADRVVEARDMAAERRSGSSPPAEVPAPQPEPAFVFAPALKLVIDGRPRQQLLNTMTLVATARANAARRLRFRATAMRVTSGTLIATLALVALMQAAAASSFTVDEQQRLALVAAIIALAALIAARGRKMDDEVVAAYRHEACAEAIARLCGELETALPDDSEIVHDVRSRYVEILQGAGARHAHVDYLAARLQTGRTSSMWRWRLAYCSSVLTRPLMLVGTTAGAALIILSGGG